MLRLSMSVSGLKKYQIKLPLRNHFHLGLQPWLVAGRRIWKHGCWWTRQNGRQAPSINRFASAITLGHVKNHHWLLLALETFMTDMFPVPTLPNSCLYSVTCSKPSAGAENEAKCGFIYWNRREAQPEMEAENGIRHSPASSAKSTQWPLFSHIATLLVAYVRRLRKGGCCRDSLLASFRSFR